DKDQVELRSAGAQAIDHLVLDGRGKRAHVDEVDARAVLFAVLGVEQLRVGECWQIARGNQQVRRNAALLERALQLIAKAVVARGSEDGDAADAERGQVVRDSPAGAGCDFSGNDSDAGNAGLARWFRGGGVIGTPAVE